MTDLPTAVLYLPHVSRLLEHHHLDRLLALHAHATAAGYTTKGAWISDDERWEPGDPDSNWQGLLKQLKRGHIDAIIHWDTDRNAPTTTVRT